MRDTTKNDKVSFFKVICRNCLRINYHPILNATRILLETNNSYCSYCNKLVSTENILEYYQKYILGTYGVTN